MRIYFVLLSILIGTQLWAQPVNDDCLGAILIPTTDSFCSSPMEFSNETATADNLGAMIQQQAIDECVSPEFGNGIWFQFRPEAPGILMTINCDNANGNCSSPQAILLTGSCTAGLEFVECTPGTSIQVTEFTVTGLTVGQRYYLFVSTDRAGTMQLCMQDFVPVPSPQSDCSSAVLLCDKSTFQVENLNSTGIDNNEFADFQDPRFCLQREDASAWYKWICKDPGSLTFTLTPNNNSVGREPDDLDFALFELPGGLDDCDNKQMIRCMSSGGCSNNFQDYIQCTGPTGLDLTSTDTDEFPGCAGGCGSSGDDDNFISSVDMVQGRAYVLIVNNFSMTGQGFSISFGGTGTFEGPETDFVPMPVGDTLACDKMIIFEDFSQSAVDPIVSWMWNFGEGAMPQTATGRGDHSVEYESFGEKTVVLTVETSRGCLVTSQLVVRVGACCEDFQPPVLNVDIEGNVCPGEEEGILSYNVTSGGNPEFTYNVAPVDPPGVFVPNPSIGGLGSGDFTVLVQDIKGCLDTFEVTIPEPEPLGVDAGFDVEVDLGFEDTLNVTVDSPFTDFTYAWDPIEGLDCLDSDTIDCPDPVVLSPGTQTYTVTVTDERGCTATDQVTVRTNIVRPIYSPNIITPTSGDENSIFKLGFGRQASIVQEFAIYDRWGNEIFKGSDITLDANNEMTVGWDGSFGRNSGRGTQFVNPGVYVWYVEVLFIDDVVESFAGDVTIYR